VIRITICLVALTVAAGAAAATRPTTVIKVISLTIRDTGTNRHEFETDRLYDGAAFAHHRVVVVGGDRAEVKRSGGREWMNVLATLRGGTIHARGYLQNARSVGSVGSVRVVGGTGRFAGARGALLIWDVPGHPALAENEYRLTR
jgi:hypothetical protein